VSDAPIRLTLEDDLRRSRLTVFFRLLLAIPHLVWLALWAIAAHLAAIANWLVTLIQGQPPAALHRFIGAYLRYSTHVLAFLLLAANPFPGFLGRSGSYPIDLQIDPPARQNRWKTGFRLILALPALIFAGSLFRFGAAVRQGRSGGRGSFSSGLAPVAAFLGWFVALITGRMPQGLRDVVVYGLRYDAQATGYLLVLTDRYPSAKPDEPPVPPLELDHPVHLRVDDDLRRSRLTVFFRLLLAIPHLVWLWLWGIVVFFAVIANWFATLFSGRSPEGLHGFISTYVRYATHVIAYLWLVANPFPGFVGDRGSYPVDLEIGPSEPQNRWKTGFRPILAIPGLMVASAAGSLLTLAGVFGWFVSLFTARMPDGLRDAGAYSLRYSAQAYSYLLVLTDRYPHASPLEGEEQPQQQEFEFSPVA
jgi:hypothetical protein